MTRQAVFNRHTSSDHNSARNTQDGLSDNLQGTFCRLLPQQLLPSHVPVVGSPNWMHTSVLLTDEFHPMFFRKPTFHFLYTPVLWKKRSHFSQYHLLLLFLLFVHARTTSFGILSTLFNYYLKELLVLLNSFFLYASSLKLPTNSDFTQHFCHSFALLSLCIPE